ncbi:hypothetical protein [Acinetobacter higginsii]
MRYQRYWMHRHRHGDIPENWH